MTKLIWGDIGQRFYEAGADRGVLYIGVSDGVPWNGLISVKESPSGGDPTPYYFDGQKYLNVATSEEFEATIMAFSSPVEFDSCDGTGSIYAGLSVTQQPRKHFGLSYRSKIGNDTDGLDHGYKLHLVYNALAAPSDYDFSTISDSANPINLSWKITTVPAVISKFKPSAHFILDSRTTDPELMAQLEDMLYGSTSSNSRLPTAQELVDLYSLYGPLIITPLPNGHYGAKGAAVRMATGLSFTIDDGAVVDHGDGSFTINY